LVDTFIACGAKSVIGPSDAARVIYELPIVNDFVYRLLCGDSVEASLDYAKEIYGEDQWEFADYLSNADCFIVKSSDIIIQKWSVKPNLKLPTAKMSV